MGILNCTPDSYYAGSRANGTEQALQIAGLMFAQGAKILDIGGQSTRPGAEEVGPEEELKRILPVIKKIRSHISGVIISVDTFHASVAEAALASGAHIINDVSGGQRDPEIYPVAAKYSAPYILMHMRGTSETMQQLTNYDDIITNILDFFRKKVALCRKSGIQDIILDPGFGFAKTTEQNMELLNRLGELRLMGLPLLVGISRKSMLYKPLGLTPETSLNATTAAHMIALQNGAAILRAHDVKAATEAISLFKMRW